MSKDHAYFEAKPTACTIPTRGALAIYCGDRPRENPALGRHLLDGLARGGPDMSRKPTLAVWLALYTRELASVLGKLATASAEAMRSEAVGIHCARECAKSLREIAASLDKMASVAASARDVAVTQPRDGHPPAPNGREG